AAAALSGAGGLSEGCAGDCCNYGEKNRSFHKAPFNVACSRVILGQANYRGKPVAHGSVVRTSFVRYTRTLSVDRPSSQVSGFREPPAKDDPSWIFKDVSKTRQTVKHKPA